MKLNKIPVTGMKDILPYEMKIRDYLINLIKNTYKKFGFNLIETPYIEHIENLTSKQGGNNEKLIFRILKRNKKKINHIKNINDLIDNALRYDLTMPLCRFYSNNINKLIYPFKSLQIGNVFRADKPQKGRFRQLMQCDIDILGDSSNIADIDIITATSTLLNKLKFKKFIIRINDRNFLKAMILYSGISERYYNKICNNIFIILDKIEKIGLKGVSIELKNNGFNKNNIIKYISLLKISNINSINFYKKLLKKFLNIDTINNILIIINCIKKIKIKGLKIIFDPTLVRGMSYYTGIIFEICVDNFTSSIGGGGRYNKIIKKFIKISIPATGFSIGFERIIMILMKQNFNIKNNKNIIKKAYIIDKKINYSKLINIFKKANFERKFGNIVNIMYMKKNKKSQKNKLILDGYKYIKEIYNN